MNGLSKSRGCRSRPKRTTLAESGKVANFAATEGESRLAANQGTEWTRCGCGLGLVGGLGIGGGFSVAPRAALFKLFNLTSSSVLQLHSASFSFIQLHSDSSNNNNNNNTTLLLTILTVCIFLFDNFYLNDVVICD